MNFIELQNFVRNDMILKSNYQPLVIKMLFESRGIASGDALQNEILTNNEKKPGHGFLDTVTGTLEKHNIIKYDKAKNEYYVIDFEKFLPAERMQIIEECKIIIKSVIKNLDYIRLTSPSDAWAYLELDNLASTGIGEKHIQILKKFYALRGEYLPPSKIQGARKSSDLSETIEIPPDTLVHFEHRLHHLTRGVFPYAGTGYAQSIQLNPESPFGFEIDRKSKTLLVHYDFGNSITLEGDKRSLQKCMESDIPVGIIFKRTKGNNKILGLGKIVERHGNIFDITSYGINEEESSLLKDETIKEFDSIARDPTLDRIEEIQWDKFLPSLDLTDRRFNQSKKLSETLERKPFGIREIIKNCNSGEWVIPIFQRYFEWNKEMVRSLLNSIFNGYYVGALLLWEVKGDPDIDVMPVKGVKNEHLLKNFVVLDGQQRIASINYAIKSPDFRLKGDSTSVGRYFYVDFQSFISDDDPEEIIKSSEHVIREEESYVKLVFPLNRLENSEAWISGLEKFLYSKASEKEQFIKINELIKMIRGKLTYIYDQFEIPCVVLPKSTTLPQVTEIFEKLNSTGKPLGTFELLIARLSKYGVKLRDLWEEETLKKHPKINEYYEKKPSIDKLNLYILESMSLSYTELKSCKRKDILDFFKANSQTIESFGQKWKTMSDYVEKALIFLEDRRSGLGLFTRDELPFEPMIPVLAALLREIETNFKDDQHKCFKKLKNWYWTSVFSVYYNSGVEGKKSSDFKEITRWFGQDKEISKNIEKFRKEYIHRVDLRGATKKDSAIFRGMMCMLALKGANDFEKSISIETEKPHKDHIFPHSKFKDRENVNSIVNMTWLTTDTNVRTKHDKLPSKYMSETLEEKYDGNVKEFSKILESHFIDESAYDCIKSDDFEEFINQRERLMLKAIGDAIGSEAEPATPTMITPDKPYTAKMIARRHIENCREFLYWIDKYFTYPGLDLLTDTLDKTDVRQVRILLSIEKVDEKIRKKFKDFKDEFLLKGITCEMRVIIDTEIRNSFHDRWIISKNVCYNMPSVDTIMRGQYSEIKETDHKPPFEEWWNASKDIVDDWNQIISSQKHN